MNKRKQQQFDDHLNHVLDGANDLDAIRHEIEAAKRRDRIEARIWWCVITAGSLAAIAAFYIGINGGLS